MEAVKGSDKVTVRSCHASGKTYVAGRIAVWFITAHRNAVVLTTAPSFRQVEDQLWREIRLAQGRNPFSVSTLNLTDLSVSAEDKWFALGLSTNDPQRFQGFHADYLLLIADEAPGIEDHIFEAVESVLTSAHSKRLYLGNPTRRDGEFYRSHHNDGFKKLHISAFQTPNFSAFHIAENDIANGQWQKKITGPLPYPGLITPAWVAERYKAWGPESLLYQVKVLGEFPEQAEDAFVPLHLVTSAQSKFQNEKGKGEEKGKEDGPWELGVDPARFGSDASAFCLRNGMRIEMIRKRAKIDEMAVVGEVVSIAREQPKLAAIKVDEGGVGAGVLDRLKELQREGKLRGDIAIIGINSSKAARDSQRYERVKDELWGNVKDALRLGELALPPDDELALQLTARRFKFNSNGQYVLERKDDYKARVGTSPDKADALALALWPLHSYRYGLGSIAQELGLNESEEDGQKLMPLAAGLLGKRF